MRKLAIIALSITILGCGGKDEGGGGGGGGKDEPTAATPRDKVLYAWKEGGLEASELTAATVGFGKDCKAGTVNGVDVLLCNYDSADAAKKAESGSSEWVASAPTATSFVSGNVLVVVADRKKADPQGKTINQLMKLAK